MQNLKTFQSPKVEDGSIPLNTIFSKEEHDVRVKITAFISKTLITNKIFWMVVSENHPVDDIFSLR